MTKYISCTACDGRKGPLFAVTKPDGTKEYICKNCLQKGIVNRNAKKSAPIMKQ